MKLYRRQKESFIYELLPQERQLLVFILRSFPLVPLSHHRLSQGGQVPDAEANQELLTEAMAEQRKDQQQWVKEWLDATRFRPVKAGFHVTVTQDDFETLLQIINDVRVGSWLALGSPESDVEELLESKPESTTELHRMQLAGYFQMALLEGVNGES